tara:strand:- start:4558 stop:8025 length:3468 start_codon:yes stop_codon:yes gene_type:complete
MGIKFSNLATTTLASGITNNATSITVADGSIFPALSSGDFFFATIDTPPNSPEIVKVTAISSNTLTVVRGQDGTTATSHASGETIALRVVAAALEDLRDNSGTNVIAGSNLSFSGDTLNLDTNLTGLGSVAATSMALASTGATELTIEDTDNGFAASKINVQNGGRDLKVTVPQDIIFNTGGEDRLTLFNSGAITSTGDITISSAGPSIRLTDTDNNPDYQIKNGNGAFRVIDTTNSVDRINITSSLTTFANPISSGAIVSSGAITSATNTPQVILNDTGNGGGGGAEGKVLFKNSSGNAIAIGYTGDVSSDSDLLISTNASGTYGGYLGLDSAAIADTKADIVLEPKTSVRIFTDSDALKLHSITNGQPVRLTFTSDATAPYQEGHIEYNHDDSDSYGSNEAFIFAGTEPNMTVLVDGKLMTKDGLYIKPSSGTGAGTQIIDSSGDLLSDNVKQGLARLAGWEPAYDTTSEDAVFYDYAQRAIIISGTGDTTTGASFKAVRFEAGDEIRFSVQVKGSASAGGGLYLRLYAHHGEMPAGKTHVSHQSGNSSAFVQEDDSGVTNWVENGALSTSYVSYQQTYTATTTGFVSLVVLNWSGNGNNHVYVRNPDIAITKVNNSTQLDGLASSSYLRKDTDQNVAGHIEFQDNYQARFGNSADLRIWHDGTNNYFRNYNHPDGSFYFQGENTSGGNEALLYLMCNAAATYVRLFYDGSEAARTVTGPGMQMPRLYIGDGGNGYFYSDSDGRTAFRSGDFYIMNSVNNSYNYATNQYIGASSGDNIYTRGNTISGNSWSITGNGAAQFDTVLTAVGSASSPALQVGDTNTGIFDSGANTLGITCNGGHEYNFTASTFDMKANTITNCGNITLYNSAADARYIHMGRGGGITFYGDNSQHHGIFSRNASNNAADDIMVSSYGAIYFDLDSNNNNSSNADFTVTKHNNGSAIWTLSGENSNVTMYGALYVPAYIYHSGDTNSYIRFVAADDMQLVSGGRQMIRMDEGSDPDRLYFPNGSSYTDSNGTAVFAGNVTAYASDRRLKTNISPIENALQKVMSIRGVSYDWIDEVEELGFNPGRKHDCIGVIAQELEQAGVEQVVMPAPFDRMRSKETNWKDVSASGQEYKTVDYDKLTALLIEAVKEQQKTIQSLQERIELLEEAS